VSPSDRICNIGHRALLAVLPATTVIPAGTGGGIRAAIAQNAFLTGFCIPASPPSQALAAFGS